jgi:RNA polymerase sigma-B factor
VSPPRRIKELAVELSTVLLVLEQRLGRTPTTEDIAHYLGISEEDVLQAMAARRSYRLVPLLALLGDDDHADRLAAFDANTRADSITVRHALAQLDPPEQRLLVWRYYEGLTQSEIGRRLGVSQAQVSRRLRELLERLRPIVAA